MDALASTRAPFVYHVDDGRWIGNGRHAFSAPEAQGEGPASRWPQFGVSVDVLEPGEGASYHRELWDDESFLVLSGECDLVIESELHRVDAGTFVHCPAGTAHVFVGAGDGPCSLVMFGARGNVPDGEEWGEYVPDAHAASFGLAVDARTSDPEVAYAGRPSYGPVERPQRFQLDRSPRSRTTGVGAPEHGAARIEPGAAGGLRRVSEGWFLLHVDDAEWIDSGRTARVLFDGAVAFTQYGANLHVMQPGEPACLYHREHEFDEVMLVLDGTGIALLDGSEHRVRAGDFVSCPAGTAHVFVAAADSQLVVLMFGTRNAALERSGAWGEYPFDEHAARFGASVERTTSDPNEAYADWPERVATSTPPWTWRTR